MITDWFSDWLSTGRNRPDSNNIGKIADSYQKVQTFEQENDDFVEYHGILGTIGGFSSGILPTIAVAGTTVFNPFLGAAVIGLTATGAAAGAGYGKVHSDRADEAEDYCVITAEDASQLVNDAEELSYGDGSYKEITDTDWEIDDIYEQIESDETDTFLRWFEDEGNDGDDWFELTVYDGDEQEVYGGSIDDATSYASDTKLTDDDVIDDLLE